LSALEAVCSPNVTDCPGAIVPFHVSFEKLQRDPLPCKPLALQKLMIGTPKSKLTVQPLMVVAELFLIVTLAVYPLPQSL